MADKLILIRHGETEWSKSGRHTSVTDLALTSGGHAAAAALDNRLDSLGITKVLTSPRRRARDTAALSLPRFEADIVDDLAEWNYGDYEGLTTDQIHEFDPNWNLWTDGCPGGDAPQDILARMERLMELVGTMKGVVACFAHGHILRSLGVCWLALPLPTGAQFILDTSSISALGFTKGERALLTWNS